ncbi:GNAT family N-acetyltransferase [Candidatus Bipolaricaulota bacterium]|nr:GNAT family N-acetyltransferase [Candidatus Bipolaricaulota bacterium]
MKYIAATKADFKQWLEMALQLWPSSTDVDLLSLFKSISKSKNQDIYVCKNEGSILVGFILVSVRSDYVEGLTSKPVGYIEGIYVREQYRNRGIANCLVTLGEQWAFDRGCVEMGSDAELDNLDSATFHRKMGFREANKIVCFIKSIDRKNA